MLNLPLIDVVTERKENTVYGVLMGYQASTLLL